MTTKRVTSGIPSVTQRGYQMEPEHNITKLSETKRNEEARAAEKEGGRELKNMSKKNNKAPATALVKNGRLRCPNCGARLGDAYYGAYVHGTEVWCGSKYCHMPVMLEIPAAGEAAGG